MRWDRSRLRYAAAAAVMTAAVVVWFVSSRVFRYHSSNHDEGVYLQHAEMLLNGRLRMQTGGLTEAFRPWFFVADGGTVYPKYTPVTGAVFAAGEALYSFRTALVIIAAVNVLLVYAICAEAFDRRVGVGASAALLFSPLFVVQSSLFLSYAPTTVFNLAFAFAYLRAWEHGSTRYAAAAGTCAGVAFFARPYTAVVFALPFLIHAAYVVLSERKRETVALYATTAVFGLVLVGVTLGYNRVMTGDALVFPYLEFAPQDGVGFGRREILGYSRVYTPELALRANADVLRRFVVDWGPGGVFGSALAVLGLAVTLRDATEKKLLVVGVGVSVIVGNVFFWGNLNILGDLTDPNDGLVHLYGTLYHFDLLLPVAALAAVGLFAVVDATRSRFERRKAIAVGVVVVLLFAGVGAANTATKIDDNLDVTDSYAAAYEPFEQNSYEGVVFLPTPYGNWLNHPFQYLRNDADLNGTTVYATDREEDNFAVIDAYPGRDLYRYAYRGDWAPTEGVSIEPVVDELRVVEGEAVGLETTAEVPDDTTSVTATVTNGASSEYRSVEPENDSVRVGWIVEEGKARLQNGSGVALEGNGEVVLEITVTQRYDSFRYRMGLSYDTGSDGVRVISPPYAEKCYSFDLCGGEAAETGGAVTTEAYATTPEEVP
jgi:hypothetical protein